MAFGISYYGQGENLAALLDLSIRNDTDGKRGLDDVMRSLFSEFYQRGRGFTTEAMIGVINRLTGRDYHDFFRRKTVKLTVLRDDKETEISFTFGSRPFKAFALVSLPNPSPRQLQIRKGWLNQSSKS